MMVINMLLVTVRLGVLSHLGNGPVATFQLL